MKTKLLVPLLVLALLAGCSEDSAPVVKPTPAPQDLCYLLEQTTRTSDGSTTIKYTYNELNQVVRSEHYEQEELVQVRTYTYSTNGKLAAEHLLGPAGEELEHTFFSYNTQGRLSKYEVKRAVMGVIHHLAAFKAVYDLKGRLTSATDYYYLDNKQRAGSSVTQTYTPGKPVTATVKDRKGEVLYKATFVQDSSRSPLSAVPVFLHKKPGIGYPNLQNFNSLSATIASDTAAYKAMSYSCRYEKNAQGYPTEATITYGDKRTVTVTYAYSCD